jgi:hypothetical protein
MKAAFSLFAALAIIITVSAVLGYYGKLPEPSGPRCDRSGNTENPPGLFVSCR